MRRAFHLGMKYCKGQQGQCCDGTHQRHIRPAVFWRHRSDRRADLLRDAQDARWRLAQEGGMMRMSALLADMSWKTIIQPRCKPK